MSDQDDLTTSLTRELHARVDTMDGGSLGLAEVRGKAQSIRRRRALTSVVAIAAAVAVIVPTAAVAGHHRADGPSPILPATRSTSPSPSPTATTTNDGAVPAPGALDVKDLPTGAAPSLAYAEGGVIHEPDGTTVPIDAPGRRLLQVSELTDGSLVLLTTPTSSPGATQVSVIAADGNRYGPFPTTTYEVAVNPGVAEAAWLASDGSIQVWLADQRQALRIVSRIPSEVKVSAAALTGPSCATSCQIYVNQVNGPDPAAWHPFVVEADGTTHAPAGPLVEVWGVDQGRLVGYTSVADIDTCSALIEAGGAIGWKSCRNSLDGFSPDGSLVLAGPLQRDGIGDGAIAMYDAATGERILNRVATIQSQAFYIKAVWEDDTHALAVVFQANRWSIVRFGSDGTVEYAVPPVSGDMDHNPFVLGTTS